MSQFPAWTNNDIAAGLTEQFRAVDMARSLGSDRAFSVRWMRESVLRRAFVRPKGSSWGSASLSSLCEFVTDGTHQPPPFTTAGVPFLFVRNIVGGQIDFDTDKHVSFETYEKLTRRRRPRRGDVLFSAVGSFGVAVVVDTDRPFTFQRHIAHLRLRTHLAVPDFVAAYLNSPAGRRHSELVAMGGAQRTVTLGSLASFEVPIPPVDEQRRVTADLNERLATIDVIESAIRAEQQAIDALPAALLRRAFDALVA